MKLRSLVFASILGVPFLLTPSRSAEIRTYRFIADGSLPYTESCDDCGPPLLGIRADIQGTFSLMLDRSAATGALLSLDSRVVNVVDILRAPGGFKLEPSREVSELRIIDPFFREFTPPIWGSLTPSGDKLLLSTATYNPNPDAMWRPGFSISLEGPDALFNMTLPAHTIVVNAKANEIIPEPTTYSLVVLLIVGNVSVATRHSSFRRAGAHCI